MVEIKSYVNDILVIIGLQPVDFTESSNNEVEPFTLLKSIIKSTPDKLNLIENGVTIAEVSQWLSFGYNDSSDLTALEATLSVQSFLIGKSISLADYAVFVSVYNKDISSFKSIKRWFDIVQHSQSPTSTFKLKSFVKPPLVFAIPSSAPAPVPTTTSELPSSSSSSKPTTEAGSSSEKAKTEEKKTDVKPEASADKPDKKSDKKEKKEKAAVETPAATSGESDDLDPSKLLIVVGKVTKCWNHPDSDKLLCEEIDIGEATGVRSIASGLRAFYSAEEFVGKHVMVLANLKERAIAGFKSNGMVLCSSNADHTNVKLLVPPSNSNIGDKVIFQGFSGEPAQPNQMAKKKIFEKLAPQLRTDSVGVARWSNAAFTIGDEFVTSELPDGTVS